MIVYGVRAYMASKVLFGITHGEISELALKVTLSMLSESLTHSTLLNNEKIKILLHIILKNNICSVVTLLVHKR